MLAKFYICPALEKWGFNFQGAKILDVGCGNAGVPFAMMSRGARCTGLDISEMQKLEAGGYPFRFVLGDMCQPEILNRLERNYDLAVVRDVIEHIADKHAFMQNILEVLADRGKIYITFPPYYSPFGGHTQNLKSKARYLPFIHLMPGPLFKALVKKIQPPGAVQAELLSLNDIRTTVNSVERVLADFKLRILQREFYAIRPTYHIRYGLKPRQAFWGALPVLRECAITAAFFYVEKT
jgi:SAM-dependent methyltransferase